MAHSNPGLNGADSAEGVSDSQAHDRSERRAPSIRSTQLAGMYGSHDSECSPSVPSGRNMNARIAADMVTIRGGTMATLSCAEL
jgi:hypothetical protein